MRAAALCAEADTIAGTHMIDMESNAHLDVIANRTKLETWQLKAKGLGSGKTKLSLRGVGPR